ncbi:MAG TPA: Rrf2 family transcriptional regulator [Terriglobales bacterium]|nr:Rrf2 family transcriptional regulator [Terriglobales bacterium]
MLSTTSTYALRALSRLALEPEGGSLLGRDLAREAHVPEQYLPKLMLVLRHAGLVGAARGTGGGYHLERSPRQIRLLEVVEAFEGPVGEPGCLLGVNPVCMETNPCAGHTAWKRVRDEYLRFLTQTTIEDLAARKPERWMPVKDPGSGGQP